VRPVNDGVRNAPYMLPFLMLVDIFLLSKKKEEKKALKNSQQWCVPVHTSF